MVFLVEAAPHLLTSDKDPVPPLPRLLSSHHPHSLHHIPVGVPEPLHIREAPCVTHHLCRGSISTHLLPSVSLCTPQNSPTPAAPPPPLLPGRRSQGRCGASPHPSGSYPDGTSPCRHWHPGVAESRDHAPVGKGGSIDMGQRVWNGTATAVVICRASAQHGGMGRLSTAQHATAWHNVVQHDRGMAQLGTACPDMA